MVLRYSSPQVFGIYVTNYAFYFEHHYHYNIIIFKYGYRNTPYVLKLSAVSTDSMDIGTRPRAHLSHVVVDAPQGHHAEGVQGHLEGLGPLGG